MQPLLFQLFPEAKNSFEQHASNNQQCVSGELMAKYVRNTLLPDLYATYLEENNDLGIDHDLTLEEFCKMVGLTTMSPKTAWR